MKEVILIYGDIHLSSKKYGAHRDYPQESLGYFKNISKVAEEVGATYIIGLGDLTYGRFTTLEYRMSVELELLNQNKICNGNRYELRGNHDVATYGVTEYSYYVTRGMIKPATNLKIGKLNLSMVDNGAFYETSVLTPESNKVNMLLMHDYFKFENTAIADYGQATMLDRFEKWYGYDYIIGGHIHNYEAFDGNIIKDGNERKANVVYLGCPSRPSYRKGHMQEKGIYLIVTVDDSDVAINVYEFPLLPLEESFTLDEKAIEEERLENKRIDISDVVNSLNTRTRIVGEPEDVIMAMENVNIVYRKKAIELLRKF